jgi:iron(III) transport system ATP-binding protein
VFVTHDQSEALALGDRLAIMRSGKVEQYDTPERVFEHPVSEYVAAFIGMDNRIVCEYQDGRWMAAGNPIHGTSLASSPATEALAVRLRAEDLQVVPRGTLVAADESSVDVVVVDSEYGGKHLDVVLDANGTRLFARVPSADSGSWTRGLKAGDGVTAAFRIRDAQLFDEVTGLAAPVQLADAMSGALR